MIIPYYPHSQGPSSFSSHKTLSFSLHLTAFPSSLLVHMLFICLDAGPTFLYQGPNSKHLHLESFSLSRKQLLLITFVVCVCVWYKNVISAVIILHFNYLCSKAGFFISLPARPWYLRLSQHSRLCGITQDTLFKNHINV